MKNITITAAHRNPGLDALRALCLFLVVLQHSFMMTDLFYPKFRMLWIISHSALDLFFILSGFLIGGIISQKYNEKGTIAINDIGKFYKRRWFKTIPMYFLTIGICLILSRFNIYYAKDFSWKFIVFLQNLFKANFNFLPHTYSLTIEEWFYLFFPLLLVGLLKLKLKINPFYILIALWIIVAISFRMMRHFHGIENWDMEIRKAIISRIDAPIYGVLFYFIYDKHRLLLKKYALQLAASGFVLYLLSTLLLVKHQSLFFDNVIYYTVIPFFMSLFLPFFIHLRLPLFFEKQLTFQSLASYSIYLIHLPLLYIIHQYVTPHSAWQSLILLVSAIFLAYVIGSILYLLIEKPVMDLRNSF